MRTPYEYMEFTELPPEAMSKTLICELITGTGKTVIAGSTVIAHLTAFVEDSKHLFYTTESPKHGPYKWKAGRGDVIKGWDIGTIGMRSGGKRVLKIPSIEGYGPHGLSAFSIPGGAN